MKMLHDIAKELLPARSYKMLINGEWVDSLSKNTMKSYNPATGELLTEYAAGNADDVALAVKAARKALPEWSNTSPAERQTLLLKIADRLEAEAERFITLETLDGGKTQKLCRNFDIPFSIDHFRYFAGVIRAHSDASDIIDKDTLSLVIREPLGVVGQIIPWNFPLLMAAWKIAPALAAGNTIIINPASLTPITLLELGRILNEVLPAGVVNIVTGRGSVVGQAILDHDGIDKVAFTGSTEIGYNVATAAAKRLIPATLELGGNLPISYSLMPI
ncbi:aldehyde dehydrogenase [Xenorhabdus szentirmaii]|nr:aldehyde dehydrogenase family protein [Xenorhabdus szentirmaii]PHM44101.1 aldehyde dehydrogenase [Xenorhabdus szentirmaii]